MSTSDIKQTQASSAADAKTPHTKRPWRAPTLILEDAKYATQSKINNPMEFSMFGTTEGPVS